MEKKYAVLSNRDMQGQSTSGGAIDIYLSGLLAVILVDRKHAWQIEADEYESDC